MNIILSLIVGGVVGWLASLVMKTSAQMGIIANVVVGILGSGVGFWLAGQLGIGGGGVVRWLVAIGGAALLIGLLKVLNIFK
jgi:uncharacterized membrane protein YeaQ/YmgE (transglycosylase-associated protein family)